MRTHRISVRAAIRRAVIGLALTGLAAMELSACAPGSPEALRSSGGPSADFIVDEEPASLTARLDSRAMRCFHGRTVNLLRTHVGREVSEDGDNTITLFQLGLMDPGILAQIVVSHHPEGSHIHVYQSGTMLSGGTLPSAVRAWANGDAVCPAVY